MSETQAWFRPKGLGRYCQSATDKYIHTVCASEIVKVTHLRGERVTPVASDISTMPQITSCLRTSLFVCLSSGRVLIFIMPTGYMQFTC